MDKRLIYGLTGRNGQMPNDQYAMINEQLNAPKRRTGRWELRIGEQR